ncbi:hypothetical protein ACFPM0_25210 [Pseudonocardia sulfidoxydans]|uniref:hypothetical protein n=1 Tax=Pseudonocardia sulfidoxydans TaxID=54011 RepID=UPI00360EEA52
MISDTPTVRNRPVPSRRRLAENSAASLGSVAPHPPRSSVERTSSCMTRARGRRSSRRSDPLGAGRGAAEPTGGLSVHGGTHPATLLLGLLSIVVPAYLGSRVPSTGPRATGLTTALCEGGGAITPGRWKPVDIVCKARRRRRRGKRRDELAQLRFDVPLLHRAAASPRPCQACRAAARPTPPNRCPCGRGGQRLRHLCTVALCGSAASRSPGVRGGAAGPGGGQSVPRRVCVRWH